MCQRVIAKLSEIRALGRKGLHKRLAGLRGDERHVGVEFLRHLERFDRLRGWEEFSLTSLWDYCTKELRIPEGAAHRRIHAMRVMRRYPQVIELLRDGRLSMTTLGLLEKSLTDDNADQLFRDASGKPTRYVEEEIVAKLKAPIVPTEVTRKLGKRLAPISEAAAEARRQEVEAAGGKVEAASASVSPETEEAVENRLAAMTVVLVEESGRNETRAVSADQFQVTITVTKEWMETYRGLAARLGPAVASKSIADVTLYSMKEVEKRLAKADGTLPVRKYSRDLSARTYHMDPTERDGVPIDLERAVRTRDGNRCQWPKPDGSKCLSNSDPQLDHIEERVLGGKTELSNLQILCGPHNRQKARERFGSAFVAQKILEREKRRAGADAEVRVSERGSLPAPEVASDTGVPGPALDNRSRSETMGEERPPG
jgi:hypothetical protein